MGKPLNTPVVQLEIAAHWLEEALLSLGCASKVTLSLADNLRRVRNECLAVATLNHVIQKEAA